MGSPAFAGRVDPIVEFPRKPPLVMNTRSFCVRSMDDLSPSWSMSMRTASFVFVPYGLRLKKPDVAWIFWIVSCLTSCAHVRVRSCRRSQTTFSTLGIVVEPARCALRGTPSRGRIIDSYWLYRVNRNALEVRQTAMWWMYRLMYSFISSAECQFEREHGASTARS